MNDTTRAPGQAQEQERAETFGVWVKCSDHLPDPSAYSPDFVLAYREGHFAATPLILKYWTTLGWADERGFGVRGVTHWMRLPAPPCKAKSAPAAILAAHDAAKDAEIERLRGALATIESICSKPWDVQPVYREDITSPPRMAGVVLVEQILPCVKAVLEGGRA